MHPVIVILVTFLGSLGDVTSEPPKIKNIVWASPEHLDTLHVEPAGNNNAGNVLAPVYIARGPVDKGGRITGYIVPEPDTGARLPTGGGQGVDIKPEVTQILYAPKGTVSWVPMIGGEQATTHVPKNVLLGGSFPGTRENLYICRANGEKVLPGFFLPSRKACTVWDGAVEKEFTEFEILCVNDYGIVSGAFK